MAWKRRVRAVSMIEVTNTRGGPRPVTMGYRTRGQIQKTLQMEYWHDVVGNDECAGVRDKELIRMVSRFRLGDSVVHSLGTRRRLACCETWG